MGNRPAAFLVVISLCAGCSVPVRPTARGEEIEDRAYQPPARFERAKKALQSDVLTLEEALAIADRMNPRLEALRSEIDRAAWGAWDDAIFPNPTLRLEVEEFPLESGRSLGRSERGFGIGQRFPIGGRLGAAATVAQKRREVAALEYRSERRRVLGAVKKAFLEILAAARKEGLARETRDLAKEFHDLTAERFRVQAIPEMELLKAAVNLAKAEADVRDAGAARATLAARLRALLGDADLPVKRFTGELASDLRLPKMEILRGELVARHPGIEVARRRKELAEKERDLEESRAIPDLAFDVTLKWTAEEDRILDAGLTIPLPIFNRNQARVAAARIRVRQAALRIQEARNEALRDLQDLYRRLEASQDRVRRYRETILPKARKALEQTNEGYRAGKFSYLDVLDAQQTFAEARSTFLAALRDLNVLASELERVSGVRILRRR